jgi:hypothetical protein
VIRTDEVAAPFEPSYSMDAPTAIGLDKVHAPMVAALAKVELMINKRLVIKIIIFLNIKFFNHYDY